MGTIIKKELKGNMKSLIIWSLALAAMMFLMAMAFDSMKGDLVKTMESYPEGMLKALGMEAAPLNKLEGFYSQGYIGVVLMGAMYAAYTGASILVKEEDEGSIEYLMCKPFSRMEIYTAKYISFVVIILILNGIIGLTTIGGALLFGGDDYSKTAIYLMAVSPCLVHLTFGSLCYGIAPLIRKNSQAVSMSIGIVSTFYMCSLLGGISSKLEILRKISIFDYVNTTAVAGNKCIESYNLVIMFGIMIIAVIVGAGLYKKKDF